LVLARAGMAGLVVFTRSSSLKILNATSETAEVFGVVKNKLSAAGTPLPINDLWIAAHALETDSIVVSLEQHFNNVPGLRLWEPADKA